MEYLTYFFASIGFWLIIAITSYIWTVVKILTDNSMTKHKKVCDLCFRDIKQWHELNNQSNKKKGLRDERKAISPRVACTDAR